jgi:hypothetical protein
LDTPAECALPYLPTMLPTGSVEVDARLTKFGTPPSVPAGAFLASILLEESALNATLEPKSTTRKPNAATACKDSRKYQDKDAMECAHPSAVPTKTSLEGDVSANLDFSSSTTSAPNAHKDRSTISTNEFAECNVEATKSTTSTVANATAPQVSTSCKEPAQSAWLGRPTTSTLRLAA